MSWVAVIWSLAAGACLTLGVVHFLVWCGDRALRASLWFAGVAFSVAVFAGIECAIMHARTPAEFLPLHRWGHLTVFFTLVFIVGFVQSYLRTGRRWLGWAFVAVRTLVVGLAFVPGPTFNFREVTEMVPYQFLGETLMAPKGVPTPWARLGESSGLLLLVFVLDAAIRLWRKGGARERQRALVVGGGVVLFTLAIMTNTLLIHTGAAQVPYIISLCFTLIVGAMAFELSRDLMHAARMAAELRENAESMNLAAGAAQVAFWQWDLLHDVLWVNPNGRALYGLPPHETIRFQSFIETLHPDDREQTGQILTRARESNDSFRAEYRVVLPDGGVRWIAARGTVERGGDRVPLRMRGVSVDITERKAAELETAQQRAELAHLARVITLSELSGSLAHELNQPLGIILSNAQAAQRLLAQTPPDLAEVRDILADIVSEDRRAGGVIGRLRALLKRGETIMEPVDLNEAVEDVLHLARAELIGHGIATVLTLPQDLPGVDGDRVQLRQVMLNLIINGADAMSANEPGTRRLHIATAQHDRVVRFSVRDEGCGLPADTEQVFTPFFTTKPKGLGLGLAICRTIIRAHSGRLLAEPHPERGAVFHFELPARQPSAA